MCVYLIHIQIPIAIIIKFSVKDTKPSGTLLLPPTQAHFNERSLIHARLAMVTFLYFDVIGSSGNIAPNAGWSI